VPAKRFVCRVLPVYIGVSPDILGFYFHRLSREKVARLAPYRTNRSKLAVTDVSQIYAPVAPEATPQYGANLWILTNRVEMQDAIADLLVCY
jgi:hypothetical protein